MRLYRSESDSLAAIALQLYNLQKHIDVRKRWNVSTDQAHRELRFKRTEARAHTHEVSSTPAATAPELQRLFNKLQENFGALTGMAQQIILDLAKKYSADCVSDAIQEAMIYEKRSLAYIWRVLEVWRRNSRATGKSITCHRTQMR